MNQYRRSSAPVLPIAPSPIAVTGHKRKAPVQLPRRETSPAQLAPVAEAPPSPVVGKPSDYWKSLLNEWKIPILDTVGIEQDESSDKNVVFLETTSERVEAYQSIELLTAVRRRDMATLKRIATDKRTRGETMNACNRFGESILHLACRKGSLDVVQFLVGDDCNCSLLLRDDYGRTVLHDACWTVNPPWELLKLILKKAPVLWRVSDIRGHLAMQYIPKSAWPQWSAFLSKNKQLLQRIMVHSYHQIDIMQQQPPPQAQQEAPNDSSTNDASAVPSQNLPQHQQPTQQTLPQQPQQNIPMPLPTPASRPVSAHNSEEQLNTTAPTTQAPQQQPAASSAAPVATQAAAAKPAPAISGTTALQAQDVLARALAQASPAMVQAISQGQIAAGSELKQGLTTFSPSTAAATPAVKTEQASTQQQSSAPGPATAALDEALRAQSENRAKARSNILLTEQQVRKDSSKQEEKSTNEDSSQAPLPYAPSISMIAERLKGYQKNNPAATVPREEAKPVATTAAAPSPQAQMPMNPLPAVPNPLLGMMSEGESSMPQNGQQQEQDVPSDGDSSNPVSSVTMSASPSLAEGNGSDTTINNTTDTDSDRAVTSSSSNPAAPESQVPMDTSDDGVTAANADPSSSNDNKPADTATEKIIVG